MNKYLKILLFGFFTWLIPFVSSFFFYMTGELSIDIYLFKSIMIIIGGVAAAIFIIVYFNEVSTDFVKESIILGVSWLVINLILDLLILIPMSKMTLGDYFVQIGIRYLVIPVMCIMVGLVLKNKQNS